MGDDVQNPNLSSVMIDVGSDSVEASDSESVDVAFARACDAVREGERERDRTSSIFTFIHPSPSPPSPPPSYLLQKHVLFHAHQQQL